MSYVTLETKNNKLASSQRFFNMKTFYSQVTNPKRVRLYSVGSFIYITFNYMVRLICLQLCMEFFFLSLKSVAFWEFLYTRLYDIP